jgi:hypothetical protein
MKWVARSEIWVASGSNNSLLIGLEIPVLIVNVSRKEKSVLESDAPFLCGYVSSTTFVVLVEAHGPRAATTFLFDSAGDSGFDD